MTNDPTLIWISPTPQWIRFAASVPFGLFQTAATTKNLNLFSLPPAAIIHGVRIKHSTAFAGTSITAVTLSVGIAGTVAKYATAFDVLQAVSSTAYQLTGTLGSEDFLAATPITMTMTSTGANLSALTAGVVDVWAMVSLPN